MKMSSKKAETVAFVPGRFSPPHKGHIMMILWLLSKYDQVVIGIGSCFEVGSARHPLLAIFREIMIGASLRSSYVDMDRIRFVHLEDFHDWDLWWDHIDRLMKREGVTHFVTGNEQDILSVMRKKKIKISFRMINPEKDLPKECRFDYHATDLRDAIEEENFLRFMELAASGTRLFLNTDPAVAIETIREALRGNGTRFIPGRQAVDMVMLTRTDKDRRRYVLTGIRGAHKENFPNVLAIPGGAVNEYESPLDAIIRELMEETGLNAKIRYRYMLPPIVEVKGRQNDVLTEMRFVGLYSSSDPALAGKQGGSSQAFAMMLDASHANYNRILKSESDLERVAFRPVDEVLIKGLAYQQTDMLLQALGKIEVEILLELIGPIRAKRVMQAVGHKVEKLIAA